MAKWWPYKVGQRIVENSVTKGNTSFLIIDFFKVKSSSHTNTCNKLNFLHVHSVLASCSPGPIPIHSVGCKYCTRSH